MVKLNITHNKGEKMKEIDLSTIEKQFENMGKKMSLYSKITQQKKIVEKAEKEVSKQNEKLQKLLNEFAQVSEETK